MPTVSPSEAPWRMWAAAWSVTAVFVLSNAPTPLYLRWQEAIGFSAATLTAIFAVYILGLIVTLLVAGQLADRFGRRPVLLPGLAAAVAACLLFACAGSVPMLLGARFLSGVAVGVAVSSGMALVIDLGGHGRRRLAALVASLAMVVGAGLGPLLAGGVALVLVQPVGPLFALELAILASAIGAVLLLPRERPRARTGGPRRWHLPGVPRAHGRHLALGVAVFGPGITATSFVLALGPSLLALILDVRSPLVAGGTACAMFLAATCVQILARRYAVRTVLVMGAAATVLAMASTVAAVLTAHPAALIAGALLAGTGQGLGQFGGLTLIGMHVPAEHRAQANALLNIGGYVPAGLLPVAAGTLIDRFGLIPATLAFAAVLAFAGLSAGVFVGRSRAADPEV